MFLCLGSQLGFSILHYAAPNGDKRVFELILSKCDPKLVNSVSHEEGLTPLQVKSNDNINLPKQILCRAKMGFELPHFDDIFKMLVKAGADVNIQTKSDKKSALHLMAYSDIFLPCWQWLIDQQIPFDVNQQ